MNTPRMIDIPVVEIDPEFRDLIPVLTADEKEALEASLLKEGCRDALVLWDGKLLDGHSRYEICKRHEIEFKTHSKTFDDRDAAKIWIIGNQLARRNLTPLQRRVLIGTQYNLEKKEAQVFQKAGPGRGKTIDQNEPSFSTAEKIAEQHHVSPATVKRAAKWVDNLSPEEQTRILKGEPKKRPTRKPKTAEEKAEGTETLRSLKRYWTIASKADRKRFLSWIKENQESKKEEE